MKLFSTSAEAVAIKTIVAKMRLKSDVVPEVFTPSSLLLGALDESYFHYAPTHAAFCRIVSVLKQRSILLTYTELLQDLSIDEQYREVLQELEQKPLKTLDGATRLLDRLSDYRRARMLLDIAVTIKESLAKSKVDITHLINKVSDQVTKTRSSSATATPLLTIGKDGDGEDFIDEALDPSSRTMLKTGIKEFDERTGGFPDSGVVLIGGTTGGGKSVLRMNVCSNILKLNHVSVLQVSLEMDRKQEVQRFLSMATKTPYYKFYKNILDEKDRLNARKAWYKMHRYAAKHDCRYSILCPTEGLSIQQLLTIAKPYGFKVIAIDYVSLLEDANDENQARVLKSIVRQCKIFSRETNSLVIILVQTDETDNRVRYSKGMLEDADLVWTFNYTKQEDRDAHQFTLRQAKVRHSEQYNFQLAEQYHIMTVGSPDEESDTAPPRQTKVEDDVINLNDEPDVH